MELIGFDYAGSSLLRVGSSIVGAGGGYSRVAMCRLLIALASLLVEQGLQGTQPSVAAAHGSVVAAPRL